VGLNRTFFWSLDAKEEIARVNASIETNTTNDKAIELEPMDDTKEGSSR
jgi:hypothetical protein